ncbi:helix-turn-helix domain-containing protein [Cupriavidus necator]
MNDIDEMALFRLGVLGPLTSRGELARGELTRLIRQIAQQEYAIPGSRRRHISEKTLHAWYDTWRREGIAGLASKVRADRGSSKLPEAVQAAVLAAKRENPRRSIRQIRLLLESAGLVARDTLSRSAVHRLLKAHGLSRIAGPAVSGKPAALYSCCMCLGTISTMFNTMEMGHAGDRRGGGEQGS